MPASLNLYSHVLCPYVQRVAIVLHEKGAAFKRHDIDLANKPDWFLRLSPLGKTPVLLADDQPVFESAVICEYLEDTLQPSLHPAEPLLRARHRAWVEFGSSVLNQIGAFYNAQDQAALADKARALRQSFERLEAELANGPYFSGNDFCMVDAAFGPVFRYFEVFDQIADFGFFSGLPKVNTWRQALAHRPSVQQAAHAEYAGRLQAFLRARGSALSSQMTEAVA
ncbi:glutathione S-transferase family protein [Parachitinimonas caeni]|uniref:glutathione transferase n=1 Tax=Parachitinimonas caeni TaxID=3031301 RepID=A0ABT7DXP3_9NEIS|nr:glutathione S-transferase family protein [Parachitinimonas caeni]MDK2124828.1 glutathione S-transferase family protein [Parachitinimonas caeni]